MKAGWIIGPSAALAVVSTPPAIAAGKSGEEQASFLAPKSLDQHQSDQGTSFYIGTAYTSQMWDGGLIGKTELLRRAKSETPADKIWRASDLAITSLTQSRGQPKINATMILDIGPDGRVVRCAFDDRRKSDILLAAQACPVIKERMRYTPALALDGKPAADQYRYRLSFYHSPVRSGEPPSAFRMLLSSPGPVPVPDATKPEEWPIIRDGYPGFRATAMKRRVPLAPVILKNAKDKVASVALSRSKDDEKSCEVVIPSGDAGLDSTACDYVVATHDPQLSLPKYGKLTMPYLVVGSAKAERAFAPLGRLGKRGKVKPDLANLTRDHLETAFRKTGGKLDDLSVALSIDAQGKPTDCRIRKSSGSDAGDLRACEIVRNTLRYDPAIDIFGRPAIMRWQGWFAKRRAS